MQPTATGGKCFGASLFCCSATARFSLYIRPSRSFMRLLLLISLLCALNGHAQLVNIESQRMQTDSVRVAGNAGLEYSYQKTNGIASSHFHATSSFQFKSKSLKHIYLVLGNYDLAKSFGMTSNHAGFGHLRYNYKINKWFRWEVFSQIQFNELLSLKSRVLGGTGARFKVNKGKLFKTYIGVASFYEYEEVRQPGFAVNQGVRMSNYGVVSWQFPKNKGEFTSVTYYQPLFSNFGDFRINSQNALILNINKYIAFTVAFNYFIDSNPPEGVDREVISIQNGLRLKL